MCYKYFTSKGIEVINLVRTDDEKELLKTGATHNVNLEDPFFS